MNSLLSELDISECKTDPTNTYQKEIKTIIENSSFIDPQNKYKFYNMNPLPPNLYGQLKLHKEGIPVRPVASYVHAPTYKLCKYLNKIIPDLIKFKPKYSIKNSIELINKVKDTDIKTGYKLVSFDVKSLFTSIPVKELKHIIQNYFSHNNIINSKELQDMINICIDQNYFQFNNIVYKQKEGLPMGSPLSPLLAEIFMYNLEQKLFNAQNNLIKYIKFWYRYVDDIICLWSGTERQLDNFLEYINKINPKIQFTMEKENNKGTLNFLDITIAKINNRLDFSIYRKPTFSDAIIPQNSCHPNSTKYAAFHSLVYRLLSIPMNEINFHKELNTIKTIGINNGYDASIVDKIKAKIQKSLVKKQLFPVNNQNKQIKKWVKLPYLGNVSLKIYNNLKRLNYNVAFYNQNTLKNILVNNKLTQDKLHKSGIYKITCNNCDKVYVGQTGRNFKIRFSEHMRAHRLRKDNSNLAKHLIEADHICTIDDLTILQTQCKSFKMTVLEAIYLNIEIIKNPQNILNDQLDILTSPLVNPRILGPYFQEGSIHTAP